MSSAATPASDGAMTGFDPVTLEVLWRRLIAITDEMAVSVARTAFSPVVRESNDLACAILDANGELISQYSMSIPSFTGTISTSCKYLIDSFPDLAPGDVLATNDPWHGAGHLPDLSLITPLFDGDEVVAYCGTVAHLADVGGSSEGAYSRDVYEEGLRIPALKLLKAGELNTDLVAIIRSNSRAPDMVMGDIEAMVAANQIGLRRLGELISTYGRGTFTALHAQIFEMSDRAMRRAITNVPDGDYERVLDLDGFGAGERLAVQLAVRGDEIDIRFDGTSAQSKRGINSVLSYTAAHALYTLKCILCPELANNAGTYRAITVQAPAGSMLNPIPGAPVGARYLSAHHIPAAIFGALAEALPRSVQADTGNPFSVLGLRGRKDGEPFVLIMCANGGLGAVYGADGYPCMSMPGNVGNVPVEMAECLAPVLFERRALARDSGGDGRWRGGCGQEVVVRSIAQAPIEVTLLSDRLTHAAAGFAGGGLGRPGEILVDDVPVPDPKGRVELQPGGRVYMRTAGGGGYGAS